MCPASMSNLFLTSPPIWKSFRLLSDASEAYLGEPDRSQKPAQLASQSQMECGTHHFLLRLECSNVLGHGGAGHAGDVPRIRLGVGKFVAAPRIGLCAVLEPWDPPVGTAERVLWAPSSASLQPSFVFRHHLPVCAGMEWDQVFSAEVGVRISGKCAISGKLLL